MMKKIICMFICILLLATTNSVVISVKNTVINTMAQSHSFTRLPKMATKIHMVESLKNSLRSLMVPCKRTPSNALVNWNQQAKLLASDGADKDFFTSLGISLSGDTALIGAWGDDDNGADSGSAYVFTRTGNTWIEQAKLLALDGAAGDAFGWCVAIEDDTALIGAAGDDMSKGSVYVFTRTSTIWTEQAKIVATDGAAGDQFGYSVYLSRDTAIIGANCDDDKGFDSGSAYAFIRTGTTWTQQTKILAPDGATMDSFGGEVSISGDTVLIGSCFDDDNGFDSGSAYIFIRTDTNWQVQTKLLASDGAAGDYFSAYAVSISNDTALIGAAGDDMSKGSTYVFTRTDNTWTEQSKILTSDGAAGDSFGGSVSLSIDTAIIGAGGDDDNGTDSGSAYVFIRTDTTWAQKAKLLASDGSGGDIFGWNVALDNDTALIGAYYDDDNGVDSGSAYIFVIENQQPSSPTITGPNSGKPGTSYDFKFNSVDPDGNQVKYFIDWSDGETDTTALNPSGIEVTVTHAWSEKGNYIIKVHAQDEKSLDGPESTKTIFIPRNSEIGNPFHDFLAENPNMFLMLQKILKWLEQ